MIPAEKRKFRIKGCEGKKTIAEMNLDELRVAEKHFNMLSCAAGYGFDATMQDYWCGAENICHARIEELEKRK